MRESREGKKGLYTYVLFISSIRSILCIMDNFYSLGKRKKGGNQIQVTQQYILVNLEFNSHVIIS